jgi:Tol biopolymer transport system component
MFPEIVGLVLLLGGCDLAFGLDGRVPPDGGDQQPCDHSLPFPKGTPVQIGAAGYSVEGARFTADQQNAYLSLCTLNQPKSTCDLYRARYVPSESRFADLVPYTQLNTPNAYDAYPTVTADGRFFLWGANRNGHLDVYVSVEDNGMFPATNLTLAAAQGLSSNEPYVLDDSRTVYFGGSTGGTWDLYRAVGDGPGFGQRQPVTSLNSTFDEAAPVVSNDELEIYFASRRDTGSYDIYKAIRTSRSDGFGVSRLAALSTDPPGVDWPLWLSPDLCTLYYINKESDATDAIATLYRSSRR